MGTGMGTGEDAVVPSCCRQVAVGATSVGLQVTISHDRHSGGGSC
jgi:hypothetical protein